MVKSMLISYELDAQQQSVTIPVSYEIVIDANIRTLSCSVQQQPQYSIPVWLRPLKFEVKSMCTDGVYEKLYSEYDSATNLHASLFIDKASDDIIAYERGLPVPVEVKKKKKAMAH